MKRLNVVVAFLLLYSVYGIAKADCVNDCTTRYVYKCVGTIFDPVRDCEENITDPLCVARCTAEHAIGIDGCDVARTSPDYQRAVTILRNFQSNMSRDTCHSIVDGGAQAASAYGLYETFSTLESIWDLVSQSTVVGAVVLGSAKVAGHCSCNDALP